ncbi:MAG: carboxypeptidase M32 [Clostridia bacterium]|nr:carboxypeptidase M32 [Clostridia bacterium]
MTIQQAADVLHSYDEKRYAIQHALAILSCDGQTAAPRQSWKGRAKTMGYLSGLDYEAISDPALPEAIDTVLQAKEQADPVLYRLAELFHDDLEDMLLFSKEEYVANSEMLTEAQTVWHEAKEKSDYALFAPYLEKIIAYCRTLGSRKDPSRAPYDVLLDTFEKGACMKDLDVFFGLLRDELTPVIQAVASKPQPESAFLHADYPLHLQRVFSDRLMAMMGIDRECCSIAETEHPFTDGVNKWDVRITTNYHADDPVSSLYSVIHEGGHALYELGVDDALQFTRLAGGSSMGIHESQSRFYENLIGRSRPFSAAVFEVARELFPEQLRAVTAEDWYRAINIATPSLVRTEADELTYPMHVLIRYEIEKQMMAGSVTVSELPEIWNSLYEKYLGIRPKCDREGILQDSHWSGAAIGYVPSYALGSAYGVQMLHNMEKEVDVWGSAEKGDLTPVTAWLRERIHRFGQLKKPAELLVSAGVAPFDPKVYVQYLKEKFTDLYAL